MGKLVLVFVCVALLEIASALDCYSCSGQLCESDTKLWTKQPCGTGPPPGNTERACLKFVFKDRTSQKLNYERKCILAKKQDGKLTHDCMAPPGSDKVECSICQDNYCNSASSISFGTIALISTAMVLLVQKLL